MNDQLAREVKRAMARASITSPELARRAGVGESWLKQVRTGRIEKPRPEWLRAIADELGLDERKLLALSDQLGSVHRAETPADPDPLMGYLARIANALEILAGISPRSEPSPGDSEALHEVGRALSGAPTGPPRSRPVGAAK